MEADMMTDKAAGLIDFRDIERELWPGEPRHEAPAPMTDQADFTEYFQTAAPVENERKRNF